MRRPSGLALAAIALVVLDAALRLVAGGPYLGATALLVTACGLVLVPLLPERVSAPTARLALLPALALGSFSLVLTSLSTVAVPLTEASIRVSVACFVALAALAGTRFGTPARAARWTRRDAATGTAVLALFGLAFASSWEVVEAFPPPGSDWGYYLFYAEEVQDQRALLVDNRYGTREPDLFGNYPGIGSLYGSALILDGVSSRSLARGIALVSAASVVSVFAATAGLWGPGAGLLAAATYAVAPIRLEPMYWHGLGTVFALVFVPLVVLALGLVYRGARDRRTVLLLGLALAGVAVAHSASLPVVAIAIGIVLLADLLRAVVVRSARGWWVFGLWRPVVAGSAVACVLGAGVIVHLRRLTAELGSPVSYRFFDAHWLDLDTAQYYFGWAFLALVLAGAVALAFAPAVRGDPALAALAILAGAALVTSQLWRVEVAFEYRRVVYYVAIAMVMVVGVAARAVRRRALWWTAAAVVLVYVAHGSIGLRLPERVLERDRSSSPAVEAMTSLRSELDAARREDVVIVADRCLGVRVRYLVRRPTLVAAEPWQAGLSKLVPAAELGKAVVRGGEDGRRVAESLGVAYVLVDPRCTPVAAPGLGARTVHSSEELRILELPAG